ncbi:hypothetical protein EZV62_005624 [Acer yangbiense]|uniref:Uncharacterized protein n=1 Tax=Acer yangbiense TaxID=1000413 RepID=A0A5C7INP0_9ROSI|nr:hypothetical protein EZV62_005624 [Acer yangbiense]
MARGVSSSCDGDIVESDGCCGSIEWRNQEERRYFYYETFSQSSSSSDGYDDNDDDMGDIFFGTSDIEELNGFIYKEEVIEESTIGARDSGLCRGRMLEAVCHAEPSLSRYLWL